MIDPILLIVVGVAVVIAIAVFSHLQQLKRRKLLAAWASEQGLSYRAHKDHAFDRRYPTFKCLRQGDNQYAYNIMEGKRGERALAACDYHYETHSTNSKGQRQTHHHHFSVVVLDTGLPLRSLFIRPENFFDSITEFFGVDDIDFESGEFSRKFFVKAPDRRWAFDVLHQETMEYMLEAPRFTLEMAGIWFMARRSRRLSPADFSAAIEVLEGILDRLPEYLLRELKGAEA
jgi:hypothetical protein